MLFLFVNTTTLHNQISTTWRQNHFQRKVNRKNQHTNEKATMNSKLSNTATAPKLIPWVEK